MALNNNNRLSYHVAPSALNKPPKNASSAAVAAVAATSSYFRENASVIPSTSTHQSPQPHPQHVVSSGKHSKAPPPPPSHHMPQQYANHFPSLLEGDGEVSSPPVDMEDDQCLVKNNASRRVVSATEYRSSQDQRKKKARGEQFMTPSIELSAPNQQCLHEQGQHANALHSRKLSQSSSTSSLPSPACLNVESSCPTAYQSSTGQYTSAQYSPSTESRPMNSSAAIRNKSIAMTSSPTKNQPFQQQEIVLENQGFKNTAFTPVVSSMKESDVLCHHPSDNHQHTGDEQQQEKSQAGLKSGTVETANPVADQQHTNKLLNKVVPPSQFYSKKTNSASQSEPQQPLPITREHIENALKYVEDFISRQDSSEYRTNGMDELENFPSSTSLRIRVIISASRAGTIIGRHGIVINSLRQDSNCKVTMSADMSSRDRYLTIAGHPSGVASVLTKVCSLFEAANVNGITKSKASPITIVLAIPSPACGCLIGRQGTQIQQFRNIYNVAFTVSQVPVTNEAKERPVTIVGSAYHVAACLREVCRRLVQFPTNKLNANEAIVNKAHDQIDEDHSKFGGSDRITSSSQQQMKPMNSHLGNSRQHVDKSGRRRYLVSNGAHPHRHHGPTSTADAMCFNDSEEKLGGAPISECTFELSNGETEVHLLVPNDIVGCIIGRGGKTISGIRETSGAQISITDGVFPPSPPPDALHPATTLPHNHIQTKPTFRGTRRDRVILIRGNSANVRQARFLMGSSILNAQRGSLYLMSEVSSTELS